MDKLFQNKWAIRVMALVFAVSLYLYVGMEQGNSAKGDASVIPSPGDSSEVQVLDDIPLDVKIDDDYVVSGVPESVTVSLEGKPRVLRPVVQQRNFKVFLDLRDLTEGDHTVNVEYSSIPDNLKVFIEPKSVEINIEKRATKEFNVNVDVINQDKLPLGYEVGEAEIDPETVTIVSSEDVIDQIAMVKVFIDATDLKESIKNREVPISVYDVQGNELNVKIDPENATISLPVERPSKKVPLSIATKGELPSGLKLDKMEAEKEIEIFGKRDILQDIDGITTKEVDLSKIDKSGEYEADLDFPDGVTANNETVTVQVALEEEKEFDDIDVDIDGMSDSDVTFDDPDTGKVKVTAAGSDKAINELNKSDIKALLKLDDLKSGKHKVDVSISGPKDIRFTSDPKKITINVEE